MISCAVLASGLISLFWVYARKGLNITNIIVCITLAFQSDKVKAMIFKYYKAAVVCMAICGIICYISFYLNLGLPYEMRSVNYTSDWRQYIDFHISYLYNDSFTVRLCGLFVEPGMFGTFIAFFLSADDLNLKKKENIILLIAGWLTLSLAFIVIIVLFLLLKNIKNYKIVVISVSLAIFWIIILPNIHTGIANVDNILSRLVIKSGRLVGDNRVDDYVNEMFTDTMESWRAFFGNGNGYAEDKASLAGVSMSSIKTYFINFGFLGTALYFIPLLLILINKYKKNYRALAYIIVAYASLYQRPFLMGDYPDFSMLICGLSYISVYFGRLAYSESDCIRK